MRVLLVCPYSLSTPGGVQGQVLGLARALRELGVDARVLAPSDGPPPEPGVVTVGPSTKVPSNGSVAPIAHGKDQARLTLDAIEALGPDVLHLHEPLVPGPNQAALLGCDVPAVGTFHAAGAAPAYRYLRKPLRSMVDRLAVRTAVSEEARRLAQEAFGGEFLVLPNGVDVPRFAKAERWPADRPVILFVGRHEERKGLVVLLDAFEGLDRDAVLWVGGEGPETEELRARGLPGVEWLGRLSDHDLARRLRGAGVFCAPSLHGESFGVVLLEAMAAGTPVVASGIPGYANVARSDREALLVPPADVTALRGALRRVLDEPSLAARLVAAGSARAAEFSLARLAERLVPVYERAMATGRPLTRRR